MINENTFFYDNEELKEITICIDKYIEDGVSKKDIEEYIMTITVEFNDEEITNYLLSHLNLKLNSDEEDLELLMSQTNKNKTSGITNKGSVDSNIKHYLSKIACYELLSEQEEIMYAKILFEKDDYDPAVVEKAKDALICHNLRLVVSIAKNSQHKGLEMMELIQEGNLGLEKAAIKYDYTKGFRFSTYATYWIRQSIQRAIADIGRSIRMPVHIHDSLNKYKRIKLNLSQKLGREPSLKEIAKEMNVEVNSLKDYESYMQNILSIDTPLDDDGNKIEHYLQNSHVYDPKVEMEKKLLHEKVCDILEMLTPKEQSVISMRFGIGYDRTFTLEEVGNQLGLTRERIRQIELKGLEKLQNSARIEMFKEFIAE